MTKTNETPSIICFESRDAMAGRMADLIEEAVSSDPVAEIRGEIAVSGGSTPQALYENLAQRDLPWPQICVTLVDERWVPADHPRSNEAFIRKAFVAADGVNITGLYNGAISPQVGTVDIAGSLDQLRKPFDVVVLGLGEDGHTASWFPHADGLDDALNGVNKVTTIKAQKSAVTGDEIDRITLTLAAVKDAKIIILLIAGDDKRKAFEKALEPGAIEDMPVRAILRARPDMWVCWAP